MTAFEEFGVLHEIGKAVDELGWSLPTDIQAEAVPAILGGGDVLMAAETGSGKTGAFCLPILQIVWESIKDAQSGKQSHATETVAKLSEVKWGMSTVDRNEELAVDPKGTTCQSRHQQAWQGCRATRGVVNRGKYYYEAVVTDEGLCRVGWSTSSASLDLGTDKGGYGYGGTGKKSNNKQFDDFGEGYGKNDVVGCFLDLDQSEIWFAKNGVLFLKAFTVTTRNQPMFPAVVLKNAEMLFNFGETPFKFPPTDGFVGLASANPEHIVKNEASAAFHVQSGPRARNAPLAIVIEPSRELAEQTFAEIKRFRKYLADPLISELLLVGGVNARDQANAIKNGVDIVVGTPGRLDDLVSSGDLSLNSVRFFVLDEADGLLTQGHTALIHRFHKNIPKLNADGRRLQIIVCSATLHNFEVKKLAQSIMHFPTWIDLKGQDSVPDTVHHVVVKIDPKEDSTWRTLTRYIQTDGVHANDNIDYSSSFAETLSEAVKLLKGEYVLAAIRKFEMDKCLIFCRTKLDCDNLEAYMIAANSREFACVCLHSDKKPEERTRNLQLFKDDKVKFMICTDVAARGIDVRGLPFVINVTLPDVTENYIHRIGRVGRADRMGLAITLAATVPEKVWYHSCQNKSCHNTKLKEHGGCCIWYNEMHLLGEIEEHLGVTIPVVGKDMNVPVDEFEGKVVYGEKRKATGTGYVDHVGVLQSAVGQLADLEKRAQTSFLNMRYMKAAV